MRNIQRTQAGKPAPASRALLASSLALTVMMPLLSFSSVSAENFWKRSYRCPGNATHTEQKSVWPGSNLMQQVTHLCNNQKTHVFEYDRNGKLQRIRTFNGGAETGWQYYLNTLSGNLMRKVMITGGRMNGPEETYYATGELLSRGQYNYGVKVGTWIYYHRDGRKKKTLQYDGRGFLLKTTDH